VPRRPTEEDDQSQMVPATSTAMAIHSRAGPRCQRSDVSLPRPLRAQFAEPIESASTRQTTMGRKKSRERNWGRDRRWKRAAHLRIGIGRFGLGCGRGIRSCRAGRGRRREQSWENERILDGSPSNSSFSRDLFYGMFGWNNKRQANM
jgi:hypothetical protein